MNVSLMFVFTVNFKFETGLLANSNKPHTLAKVRYIVCSSLSKLIFFGRLGGETERETDRN